jgi:hypothetical protein
MTADHPDEVMRRLAEIEARLGRIERWIETLENGVRKLSEWKIGSRKKNHDRRHHPQRAKRSADHRSVRLPVGRPHRGEFESYEEAVAFVAGVDAAMDRWVNSTSAT